MLEGEQAHRNDTGSPGFLINEIKWLKKGQRTWNKLQFPIHTESGHAIPRRGFELFVACLLQQHKNVLFVWEY